MARPERPIIGRLVEVRRVTASSEVTGRIIEMPVEEGSSVSGGETVLARVDDIWSRLAMERYRAQCASTQARLDYEQSELQRIEALRDQSAASESEMDEKRAVVAELQAKLLELSTATEEESEKQLRSVIHAPFDGTVVVKHAELGEHVTPGSPIVDIVSRGQADARLMVPEAMVNFISLQQPLTILIDPLGDSCIGRVVSITPLGASASRTFPVRIRLDDQGGRLKVGMSVTATIPVGGERTALVVPKDAVLIRPDGSTVWAITTDSQSNVHTVHPVPVTVSIRMEEEYAVVPETAEGRKRLVSGAQVVIEGAERLLPGCEVTIVTLNGE
jgi:RND family efflux transporter MFP subunit